MTLLALALKRRLGTLHAAEIGASVARTLGASVLAALASWGTVVVFSDGPRLGPFVRALPGVLGGSVFVMVFLLSAFVLGSGELKGLLGSIRARLSRRRREAAR